MSFVSYAQAGEDILLWRALSPRVHYDAGFYIDVGAYDPEIDSVTKTFYDCGWCGINIEPVRDYHRRFVENRIRDINLPVAVSDKSGQISFHEIVGQQLGTIIDDYAERYRSGGFPTRSYAVDCLTLTDICDQHVGARPIHFLKIGVEGHEGAALRGMNFRRYRPWILVIEATEPNRTDLLTHREWDRYIIRAGYIYAGTTLPNRYYVAREHADLADYFKIQPDIYERAVNVARREKLEREAPPVRHKIIRGAETVAALQPRSTRFIGCATDANFVVPTAVMLSSIDANGDVPDAIVLVAAFDLTEEHRSVIRLGAGKLASQLQFLEVDEAMYGHIKRRYTEQYPPAVLGRLFIANTIETPKARLLTLDSDMIVNRSLHPLFAMDLKGQFFAAVHDLPRKDDPNCFNSGMTMTDVDAYKHHDIGARCLQWLAANPQSELPDQEALNYIVGDSWYRLDGLWNRYLMEGQPITLQDFEDANIAHFADRKPWLWDGHPAKPLYSRYRARLQVKIDQLAAAVGSPHRTAKGGDLADRDFIASCYEVLLGRELESDAVVRERSGWPTDEVIQSIVTSLEFGLNVLRSVREDIAFPDGIFTGKPSQRQRFWAADRLPLTQSTRECVARSEDWHDLLAIILSDAMFKQFLELGV